MPLILFVFLHSEAERPPRLRVGPETGNKGKEIFLTLGKFLLSLHIAPGWEAEVAVALPVRLFRRKDVKKKPSASLCQDFKGAPRSADLIGR